MRAQSVGCSTHRPMVKGIPWKLRLLCDRIDMSFTAPSSAAKHHFKTLICMFYGERYIQVHTGQSYIFYFGIFICCATLRKVGISKDMSWSHEVILSFTKIDCHGDQMTNFQTHFHEKWGIPCGSLVIQPCPFSPRAILLISTQPSLYDQTYRHTFHCIQTENTSEDRILW